MILNKYMKRGLLLLLVGTALNLVGMSVMHINDHFSGQKLLYGWSMIIGVALFGAGFLYILYSLIRKVERHAILEERAGTDEH